MDCSKKTMITTAVVFIIMNICSFVIHQVIMGADYAAMKGVFRPMNEISMPVLTIAYLIAAIFFVQIYLKGQENGSYLSEGTRFGLFMSGFSIVPMYLMNYAVMPFTVTAIAKGMVAEVVAILISSIAAAYLLKK